MPARKISQIYAPELAISAKEPAISGPYPRRSAIAASPLTKMPSEGWTKNGNHTYAQITICTNSGVPRNSVTYSSETLRNAHASTRIGAPAFSK
ncbi:Uncharacterised protein [Neisseria meningitidis]|nr:Uncharacterised protein [Neisseria meningitidis]CWQ70826.1 Uncharacterised protein [Neisseria meningitidis]CWQ87132.1 Uncharacterised protein [Neisseria meningitidis]CWT25844.1 Uncharacterised protein [Neisseria meningitidis]